MPIYEYQCTECGHTLEKLQKLSDAPLSLCPACDKPALQKLVSAAGFRLKGGGWYETDFKNKSSQKNVAKADSAAKSDSSAKGASAAKTGSADSGKKATATEASQKQETARRCPPRAETCTILTFPSRRSWPDPDI